MGDAEPGREIEVLDAEEAPELAPIKKPGRQHALTTLDTPSRPRKRAVKAKDIVEVEKMATALSLRKEGRTFEEIAKELGFYDASGASKFVKRALALTVQESVDEMRQVECERLDDMLRALYPKRSDARTAEVMVKLLERRSKLMGLDAPERRQISAELRSVNLGLDASKPEARAALHELLRTRPAEQSQPNG